MTLSLADIDKFVDDMRANATSEPNRIFVSLATYRELQHVNNLVKRGKPYIRAKRKCHKSLMRMSRELREEARRHQKRRNEEAFSHFLGLLSDVMEKV